MKRNIKEKNRINVFSHMMCSFRFRPLSSRKVFNLDRVGAASGSDRASSTSAAEVPRPLSN